VSSGLQSALEALYGLERRKDKLGLDGTRDLLRALGDPQRRFRAVHVAGTNGKGTVCALIERVLREAGLRTGLFTSPHLVDFRERIRVGGRWADEQRLETRLAHIQSLPEGRERTFFEVCTALAFDDFAARGVEWAVVEVGLGGRLDCTNVLTPEVAVITSIGLDHTEILGDTIEQVAEEKAGIIKPGVPVVSAPERGAAADVIRRIAAARGAPWIAAAARVHPERGGARVPASSPFAVAGCPPLELDDAARARLRNDNLGCALAAIAVLRERGVAIACDAIAAGIRAARWPGRFEPCPAEPRLWWDGAHNTDGTRAVVTACRAAGLKPAAVILAVSRDKDAAAMLGALAELEPRPRLIATRSRSERALEPVALAALARAAGFATATAPAVERACRLGLEQATGRSPALLTGSLFAVGEAMEAFGGAPGEWQ
jgi:dihydrofolate synthase/folylpolyglutamate synthase